MNNCYRKSYPYSMFNMNKNAKLGNVLVTWPCVVCDGNAMVGILGEAGWGEWEGGWSGRSHTSDHCAHIHSVQCIPV